MNTQLETLSETEIANVAGGIETIVVIGHPVPAPGPNPGFSGGDGFNCHDDPSSVICPDPLP